MASEVDGFEDEPFDTDRAQLPALVSRIEVEALFGRYSYSINIPQEGPSDRLVLFYGDNGTGKTTILRILWHLLSPAPNQRHRTRISRVPFKSFRVVLEDGTSIEASRVAPVAGPYTLTVTDPARGIVSAGEWPSAAGTFSDWESDALETVGGLPEELVTELENEISRRRYLEVLERLRARPYFLADDRNIYSDELEDRSKERRLKEQQLAWARSERGQLGEESDNSNVAAELQASMNRANDQLRRMTLGGTQSGSANANAVYLEVLTRLAAAQPEIGPQPDLLENLRERVFRLSERSKPFESLRLVPEFPGTRFGEAIESLGEDNAAIADEVLGPFLSSLDARLDALDDAQTLISTFLNQTNGFLRDKYVRFSPQTGLRISTEEERLSPLQLSSGERQLVLLLCNALLARDGSRIFLIDEPELSLNVKWQRRIVDALLETTNGTPVQFFIATHSVELLSNYQGNVVRLENVLRG